jgi:REP element-mobilizing transposase RayT
MLSFHLTARSHFPLRPFVDRETCARFWAQMRRRFPKASGLVLMPNHVHLVIEASVAPIAEFGIELRALARWKYPGKLVWEEGRKPEPLPDDLHFRRNLRYIYLNPCREGLVKDPLAWEWSTYREIAGATAHPWPAPPPEGFPAFHRYVSGDPSVRVDGTPPPVSLTRETYFPASTLVAAVRAALRLEDRFTPNLRTQVVALAPVFCRATQEELAEALGITARRVRQIRATASPRMRRAIELLLGDPRLRPDERGLSAPKPQNAFPENRKLQCPDSGVNGVKLPVFRKPPK